MQREFLALVAEARADGRTMFLSSHNLVEVERACDRVAIIRDGRIVDVSTVGELLGSHWRSINLVLAAPPAPDAFDLPNVEVAAMTGREVHLMVRGDVNPLLDRIAAHEVARHRDHHAGRGGPVPPLLPRRRAAPCADPRPRPEEVPA